MQVIDFIASHGAWSWVVAGLVLLALELVLPGGVLIWLGGAALVTGALALLVSIFWPLQFVIFGVLALVSIGLWLKFRGPGVASDRPFLNQRANRFIGQEAVLDEPIRDGIGRLALDDTVWRVQGPDLAAGSRVRIVDADGALLKVEAA
ncbi:NfeD family protein [Devosia sp. A16]|uniref:NfeD family protein n=1 Tax=Devosia sp. A16 TaxID=1736675 RepID=UPI0006D81FFC|nr:NfeD family protein [Devosia sp. A16]